ncbi:uncharacterized protein LOC110997101 [Pieris rapae]|uniref:uncharacterized protein LOC110997101 n=1 Tax=Pieris rapae TaxID=64459 RepID=UPI001E27CFD0|nr:uncharacterized protein LOC110997101 [Pieris rapae]XP_022120777.2 uncharacterized protein LOC110997101 [Pieris rapae]XP_045490438.1 uncharacterized protein LOC110997101 [Pieris rapae]
MESDYDRKFEEMKAYIPFLERMITRLDIGNTPRNPRQAQLDKIRSLRDLLQNKKKRMKMENLLKCEQVLITLHAKVEQRDAVTEKIEFEKKAEASDLNVVRNKLKSVVSRLSPEADRDGDITEVEFKRNNEPALFQRRPNQKTISPMSDDNSSLPQSSKRNYTRVLHSPDKSSRHWPENSKTDQTLFSRRSPRKTSHRYSPSYKKEKKKSKKNKQTKRRGLNITLNVPEEKLNSLDTDDILTRIINCSDSDVDISTLRELRSQILGELKHTGVKDDISELLLKSCQTKTKKKLAIATEIEEGELSDSESEAIENIYGSLVITNKDTSKSTIIDAEKDKSRKIQICLVINSGKNEEDSSKQEITENKNAAIVDNSEFQSFSHAHTNVINSLEVDENEQHGVLDDSSKTLNSVFVEKEDKQMQNNRQECEAIPLDSMPIDKDKKIADKDIPEKVNEDDAFPTKGTHAAYEKTFKDDKAAEKTVLNTESKTETKPDKGVEDSKARSFIPNFYNSNKADEASQLGSVVKSGTCQEVMDVQINKLSNERETVKHVNMNSSVEIPLLDLEATNKKDIVSEIDILQALKKEILGETTITPIITSDDTNTPALHQPKITKVARAQEIVKKRISIENYKQKCNEPLKPLFCRDISQKSSKEDHIKKQSLKLTEKECERFKLPIKLPLNDSSEDDDDLMESLNDYSNLAPKSPDHEDFADLGIKPPVIIPSDPVKPIVVNSFLDVDMRNVDDFSFKSKEVSVDLNIGTEKHLNLSNRRRTNSRWEIPQSDETYKPEGKVVLPGISSDSQQPSMTPSRNTSGSHNMTPSRLTATSVTQPTTPIVSDISSKFMPMIPNARTYEMTPSRVDSEDISASKHVYAPMFSGGNKGDRNEQRNSEPFIWEMNTMLKDNEFDSGDSFGRYQSPHTPIQSFARHEGKATPLPSLGRIECPTTPLPSFGRRECSLTPLPSFGRNERAMTPVNSFNCMDGSRTPVHSYGRTDEAVGFPYTYNRSERLTPGHSFSQFDGSSTPIHAYGRADAPTPSYSFGRSDDSRTPAHSYGGHDGSGTRPNLYGQDGSGTPGYSNYSEGCTTPSHSFGRTDYMRHHQLTKPMHGRNDPRLNRSSDFDNYKKREDNREYGFYKEQKYNHDYGSDRRGRDDFRKYKQNFGRNDMNRFHGRKNEGCVKDLKSGKDKFDKRYSHSKETFSYRDKKEYQFYGDRYNLREHSADRYYSNHRPPCNTYENDSDLDGRLDRSENTSLQNIEQTKKSLSCFDNRRRRASSVGRVLVRERSIDRSTHDKKRTTNKSDIVSKRKDFHRASSVGKELHMPRSLSFKNIKDDLRLFKIKNDVNIEKRFGNTSSVKEKSSQNKSDITDTRKSDCNLSSQKTQSVNRHSLKNYYQNPKLRRDSELQHKEKYRNKSQFRYHKKPGITYSDANISKGTILGPGCGVKNYKIPKIKRPLKIDIDNVTDNIKEKNSEEKMDRNSANGSKIKIERIDSDRKNPISKTGDSISYDVSNDKKDKANLDIKNTETKDEESDQNILKLCSNRRITRSSVISTSSTDSLNEEVIVKRTKKYKTKQMIYDETESENEEKVLSFVTVQSDAIKVSKILDHHTLESSDLPNNDVNLGDHSPTQKLAHNKELSINILNRNNEIDKQSLLSTEELNINNKNANTKKSQHSVNKNVTQDISLPASELNIPSSISDSTFSLQQPVNEIKKNIDQEVRIEKKVTSEQPDNEGVNSSFGDLEIFSDTIASDPVLDNINALIANLDHDIDTVKNNEVRGSFKQDFLLDHMFDSVKENRYKDDEKIIVADNIESTSKEMSQDQGDPTKNLADIDMSSKNEISPEKNNVTIAKFDVLSEATSISSKREIKPNDCIPKNIDLDNNSSDAIVSTTKDDIKLLSQEQNKWTESHASSSSRPDSTNNVVDQHKITNATAPDSTNESNESSDLISSSNSEVQSILTVDSSQSVDKSDTIGNFLSILQDKTKIRELLSLLGEQSVENVKIKKKLEKLSAIESDDEDDINNHCNITKVSSDNTNEVIQSNNDVVQSKSTAHLDQFASINTSDDAGDVNDFHEHKSDKLDSVEMMEHNDDKTESATANEKEVFNNINKNIPSNGETESECTIGTKVTKKGRGKKIRKGGISAKKRLTRSVAVAKTKTNKPSRELLNLQADIREMFLKDDEDILGGTTGLRMCRLAKLGGENSQSQLQEESSKNDTMEKLKKCEDSTLGKTPKRKYTKKLKSDRHNKINEESLSPVINETVSQKDPYLFEIESLNESILTAEKREHSPKNDSDSAESSQCESSEQLFFGLKKKPKRKRSAWQSGIILPKNKKKKLIITKPKIIAADFPKNAKDEDHKTTIANVNCYVDKLYCFSKSILEYDCKLCDKPFKNIVCHYRKEHPHSEIPLSRMSPDIALEAIKQCETIDFRAICEIPSYRYVCRFCFKEFTKCKTLESFFWHIVSAHTGEYKEPCSVCEDNNKCPLALDIPPPPKKQKGQLIGYICGNCNYTQLSLENLKTHVITRHNDEQTEVYTINMSHLSVKALNSILKQTKKIRSSNESEEQRVLRSTRTCANSDITDEKSDITDESDNVPTTAISSESNIGISKKNTKIHSKITFENDTDNEEILHVSKSNDTSLKVKKEPKDIDEIRDAENELVIRSETCPITPFDESNVQITYDKESERGTDINESPHFKITYTESGSKLYVCCINGHPHYRTALMISFKKHIQVAHIDNKWDGYCCICKVIVMPQGLHSYRSCLDHLIDKHLDNFPVLEIPAEKPTEFSGEKPVDENIKLSVSLPVQNSPKPFLSVRPLSELLSNTATNEKSESSPLPVIESIASLGNSTEPRVSYPTQEPVQDNIKCYLYEEAQAEIMSKKNIIILDAMIRHDKLVQVFKCAGRFCSYTTNSAEDALLHVSTHSRIGGDNALKCAYCDFDCLDNAIDLVTHVFKYHGFCQYVCGFCFYRASASQLVNAHIGRVHENVPIKTILKSLFTTAPIEANMLSREAAVPTYVCTCDDEDGVKCKFKTYTPGKLCEHIKGRHKDVTIHECFMCNAPSDSVEELILHYKSHGLKLYQCAWCVYGADTENELLTHSSIHHAVCQPKAYLRVITNKEGTSEFRVLPLAHLNKSILPNVMDVSPTGVRENPVREAERSIDLEKLIGHTTSFIEPTDNIETETPNEVSSDEPSIAESMLNFTSEPQSTSLEVTRDHSDHSTPVIKSEVVTPSSPKPGTSTDVICLDSDDEDLNTSNVSRESNSNPSTQEALGLEMSTSLDDPGKSQFRLKSLYKCATCSVISKNSALFKAHLSKCFPNQTYHIPCAFCSYTGSKKKLPAHYTQNHLYKPKSMVRSDSVDSITCGPQDKARQQSTENSSNIVISTKKVGGVTFTELTAKKNIKRKTSAENSLGPPVKVTKYGPHEIHKLPINPILENFIYCSLCEFTTKVRLNMVRHLQLHANQQPVPQTAPVNPVPHLETNEMHFDKMLNLASSSLAHRQDKHNKNDTPTIPIPPEKASTYPKYVPERTRHTCGAKGCSYISVDENMLKCHWDTLHSGSNDFHCVHCPPYQKLDTKTPVTASRIIAHLKMHDAKLYACSQCRFYHFNLTVVEKHVNEAHNRGDVMVVREEVTSVLQTTPPVSATTAPTMDLKPWQCGLCEYKTLLRPEIVEHCAKTHNSKMQFKCVYCAFRTSNEENVIKHQSQSHQEFPAATFYFYYREGSMPNQADGTPFWKIQKQNYGSAETKIKSEKGEAGSLSTTPVTNITPPIVNISIVKQEVVESVEESIEDLCKLFGQFCEPNGLKYKCPLCTIVIEDTKEGMQSHLYEELQYRKWSCSICFYKAFHRRGLSEHMTSEHRVNRDPVELPIDTRVETWVAGLLQHQEAHIENSRKNWAKQKAEIIKKNQSASELKSLLIPPNTTVSNLINVSKEELESKFGALGASKDMAFCCPKCNEVIREESTMRNHLESELNKIRWCCSTCPKTFTSYHQAQFHCKTHSGQSSRPVEAPRDSDLRTAWVDAVLEVQKLSMNCASQSVDQRRQSISPDPSDNSLLVVRYEERVPTPENQSFYLRESPDSDVDRLVISEMKHRKRKANTSCKYCDFSSTKKKVLNEHILQIHYDLKPYTCEYCKVTGTLGYLKRHQKVYHTVKPINIVPTQIPIETPSEWAKKKLDVPAIDSTICLTCQSPVLQSDIPDHVHENTEAEFGRIGEVIIKCSTCSTLHKNIFKFEEHRKKQHSKDGNYVFYKLTTRRVQAKCSFCPQKFTLKKDLKAHTEASHAEQMKYANLEPQSSQVIVLDDEETMDEESPRKRVARKSTSKLPFSKPVARKSTTKLPMENQEEYSFYGTKPCLDSLENVTTMMPFYNSYMPVTFERLSGVLNINPRVVITKLPK